MKRIIFRLFITIVTFALGVATSCIWLNSYNSANRKTDKPPLHAEKKDISTELPILAFCELANNPENYDGKAVRVSAKFRNYDDGFRLRDLNCYGLEKEAAIVFDANFREIMEKIGQELGNREFDYYEMIEIIAVGKFSRAKPNGKSSLFVDNAYLHFEIVSVEKASALQY